MNQVFKRLGATRIRYRNRAVFCKEENEFIVHALLLAFHVGGVNQKLVAVAGKVFSRFGGDFDVDYQGSEQSYWNVGVNLAVPLEDILDLSAAVKRKKLEVDQAVIAKDIAYDQLKLQIASLYVKITNNLVTLKTLGEAAAAYQGAGALNREDFENGNMNIEEYAYVKMHESGQVSSYQSLQTTITTDIITLEILTHTPIITNSTTEITLDTTINKSEKEIAKENKEVEKRIKKAVAEDEKKTKALEKAEKKAEKAAAKAAKNTK